MRHIAVDEETYRTVKTVAEREGRLLKGVVKLAVEAAYGPRPLITETEAQELHRNAQEVLRRA